MTTRFLIAFVACALAASRLPAQSEGPDNFIPNQPQKGGADPHASDSRAVKYTLLLPSEKSSEAVKDEERNPFGKSEDEVRDLGGKSSNEETKIQETLSKLHATGLSPGPSGLRVLFGDMWLSKDDVMPPVIKDQTLALRVNDISREALQLVWMEKKFTGLPPRLLVIPVDLRATVRRVPHGQAPEKAEAKTESKASKRATAVEFPVALAATTSPAEARKAAQLALAPLSATALKSPGVTDPAPAAVTSLPAAVTSGPTSQAPATQTPVDPAASPAQRIPSLAARPEPAPKSVPPAGSLAPMLATQPGAAAAKPAAPPPANEPPKWKRELGLMDNLVKLSEANK